MTETSPAGPSAQSPAPPSHSLDIERGPAELRGPRESSPRISRAPSMATTPPPAPAAGAPRAASASEPCPNFADLFIGDNDPVRIANMPGGWVKLAAEQNLFFHRRTCRRFGSLLQKLIICGQKELTAIEAEMDRVLDGPGGKERFIWEDPLMRQAKDIMLSLGQLVQIDEQLRDRPVVDVEVQYAHYEDIRLMHNISQADSAYMLRHHDTVQLQPDLTDWVINTVLYSAWGDRIDRWAYPVMFALFGHGSAHRVEGQRRSINLERLRFWLTIIIMLSSELILLSPVLVLYLVPMSKATTAGICVVFIFALAPFIYYSARTRFGSPLVGMCGVLAILVAFLAQLNNGTGTS